MHDGLPNAVNRTESKSARQTGAASSVVAADGERTG
jgi:hypothetical protein